ncbi:Bystin-domain-containing protein [Dunaliella salina]|uniref:Bystin-domain-containing protein n=1 Tax=Dunaliella salina TaxID=3046 RepID=A0ABQ7H8P9_DUNSA|nr:Bystin-domain-containing protein [Dunaliella salina]|eukprot:KAF5843232.1 Bystin-domain-containing protein [Dunaliella salina]
MVGKGKHRVKKDKHRQSLGEQIDDPVQPSTSRERPEKRKRAAEEETEEQQMLSAKLSGRILKAAREQQQQVEDEEAEEQMAKLSGGRVQMGSGALSSALRQQQASSSRAADSDADSDEEDEYDMELRARAARAAAGRAAGSTGRTLEDEERFQYVRGLGGEDGEDDEGDDLGPEEEAALAAFMAPGAENHKQASLGDIIFEKLREKQREKGLDYVLPTEGEEADMTPPGLDEKVIEGLLLPLRASRTCTLHEAQCIGSYLAFVLENIPAQGLLLPLCASRTCTLREAVIFSAVLRRTSIPVLHSAAALLRMAELEYCGTTSFFMRVLLDKKYALPYRVIDSLVDHFVRFADDERDMPVVWHQTLLCFIQRYKDEIRPEDKAALRKLCSEQSHYLVTPEVYRELDHSRAGRGGSGAAAASGAGPSAGVRASGADAMQARSHLAGVIGKNVSENVSNMPPVMIMEDD